VRGEIGRGNPHPSDCGITSVELEGEFMTTDRDTTIADDGSAVAV
jgi:hypothetical protein